jgi:Zn ribbon nucleic-acid-binding protein
MEKVIECPLCNDKDRCFEDVQDTFSSFMCFNCGYMSHSNYTEEKISEIPHTSQLIRDLAVKDDDRDIYWYPSVVNMGKLGIIYPDGLPNDWNWKFAKVVQVSEEEQKNYPIPGKDEEYYTERLDVDNAQEFGQYEFLEACKSMGIVKDGVL